MVHGLEKFKEYFKDHTSQYVFIGGMACEILMDELGAPLIPNIRKTSEYMRCGW